MHVFVGTTEGRFAGGGPTIIVKLEGLPGILTPPLFIFRETVYVPCNGYAIAWGPLVFLVIPFPKFQL